MVDEKILRYEPRRDVVFIFGAGASYADGLPLRNDLMRYILNGQDLEINNNDLGKLVQSFIHHNFIYDPDKDIFPNLESVFGYLDYFIEQKESLGRQYDTDYIYNIKEALIKLIHYTIAKKRKKKRSVYSDFWKSVKNCNRNISIVALNYDTNLEEAFTPLFPEFGFIDYCIPLMNYEIKDSISDEYIWIDPRSPIFVERFTNPKPIKIIKIHGSLDWKYCNCCNQILLTPQQTEVDIKNSKFPYKECYLPDYNNFKLICPIDGTIFQSLIIPPSYLKPLNHPIIAQLMNEASREIRISKRLVFVGYSLSDADIHIKAILKKSICQDTEIVVINNAIGTHIRHAYRSLSNNVHFIERDFEYVVNDDKLMCSLLIPEIDIHSL